VSKGVYRSGILSGSVPFPFAVRAEYFALLPMLLLAAFDRVPTESGIVWVKIFGLLVWKKKISSRLDLLTCVFIIFIQDRYNFT